MRRSMADVAQACIINLRVKELGVKENASTQISAMTATDALQLSSNSLDLESPPIHDADSLDSAGSFEQAVRVSVTILMLILLVPAMLTLSLLAMLVAQFFDVPLYAPSSSEHKSRSLSE